MLICSLGLPHSLTHSFTHSLSWYHNDMVQTIPKLPACFFFSSTTAHIFTSTQTYKATNTHIHSVHLSIQNLPHINILKSYSQHYLQQDPLTNKMARPSFVYTIMICCDCDCDQTVVEVDGAPSGDINCAECDHEMCEQCRTYIKLGGADGPFD